MRKLLISLAVIAGISVLPVFWVLNTAQGLRWLIVIADGAAPGELVIDKVGGRAVGPIRLHGVGYRDREGNTFSATELEIDWQPLALLQKRLIINSIRLGGVATELAAGVSAEANAPRQPLTLPELRLPLTLALEDIELNDVSVHRAGAELVTIERARLSGRWDENGIKIEQLQVEERRGALALHGDLKPWDGYPVTAVIDWRFAAADYLPASGTVALSGDIARLEAAWSIRSPAAIDGTVEVMLPLETPLWRASVNTPVPLLLRNIDPGWPDIEVAGRVEAEGDLDAATLKLSTTRPAVADAAVEFGPFNADMRWQARIDIREPIALDTVRADWPALRLSGSVDAMGSLEAGELNTSIRAETAEQSLEIKAAAAMSKRVLVLDSLSLRGVDMESRAELSARIDLSRPEMPFNALGSWQELHWPLVDEPRWTSRQGTLTAEGNRDRLNLMLEGTLDATNGDHTTGDDNRLSVQLSAQDLRGIARVTVHAAVPYFAMPGLKLRDLDAAVQVDLGETQPSFADISVDTLTISDNELSQLEITGSGTNARHVLKARARYGEAILALAGEGAYAGGAWRGQLTQLDVAQDEIGPWSLQQPAAIALASDDARLEGLCLQQGEARLCGDGQWQGPKGWRGNARLVRLPTARLGSLWRGDFDWRGEMSAELALSGGDGRPVTGTAQLQAPAGSIAWVYDDEDNEVSYTDVSLSGDISVEQAVIRLAGRVGEGGVLEGRASVSHPFDADRERNLDGAVSLDLPSLSLLEVFLPDLHFHQGTMTLRMVMAGPIERPRFSGDARVDDAQLDFKALGIGLHDLKLRAEMLEQDRLRVEGSGSSGRGSISIDGEGTLLAAEGWSLRLHARGKEVEALNLPEAHLVASPDLHIGITAERLDINGEVFINEAQLKPELSTAGVTLSPDIVVESGADPAAESRPTPVYAQVKMILGDQVRLNSFGIEAELGGQLDIAHAPGKVTTANGEIVLHKGRYSIYGRSLTIDPGRLVFTGGAVDDPGLDVRAIRTAGDVTAGVRVSGTARAPQVELFSDPALPDSEKLSYLLLGRPTSQANREEGAVLVQAALAMLPGGAGGAGQVGSELRSTFGIDTVSIESNGGEDQGRLLVLGKYLSPRLYVSYGAGVAGALNVFRVRYEMSRRWLLTSETSSRESSSDILYSIER